MIITFEGTDSVGKTTHVRRFLAYLKEKYPDRTIEHIKLPDYTSVTGARIRAMLGAAVPVDHTLMQSLMVVNRLELLPPEFYYISDTIYVVDRYTDSGIVYGMAGGLDEEWLRKINYKFPKPHLTYLLTMPLEKMRERRPNTDNFEALYFQVKVKSYYEKLLSPDDPRVAVVNTDRPVTEAEKEIQDVFVTRCAPLL